MIRSNRDHEDGSFRYGLYMAHLMGWSVLLTFVLIAFVLAVLFAFPDAVRGEAGTSDWVIVSIVLPLSIAGGYYLYRWAPDFAMGEPMTPRGKRIRWLLVAIVVICVTTAMPIIIADQQSDERITLFANSPLPQFAALAMIGLWGLLIPVLAIVGWRNADDFNRATQAFGMMVGFQVFAWTAPLWWIAWRSGLMPRPDVMVLFVTVLVVSTIANFWKRANG